MEGAKGACVPAGSVFGGFCWGLCWFSVILNSSLPLSAVSVVHMNHGPNLFNRKHWKETMYKSEIAHPSEWHSEISHCPACRLVTASVQGPHAVEATLRGHINCRGTAVLISSHPYFASQ